MLKSGLARWVRGGVCLLSVLGCYQLLTISRPAREHSLVELENTGGMQQSQPLLFMQDFITNKRYISLCDVAFKTRSRNDLKLPLKPNAIVCVKGEKATLTEFFKLDIQTPFTLVTLENDEATPQDLRWLKHKHLHRWYSWNSNHPDVIPIPIGLNEDSQLQPMARARPVKPKIPKMLANFKTETAKAERQGLYDRIKDMAFAHVEPYHKRYDSVDALTAHYEAISAYKWTLCPRGAGQDTHRLWEALYLGSIPVVLKSSLSSLYEGLPVIQLNSWDELSFETLMRLGEGLPQVRHNAYFEHWARIIRAGAKLPQPETKLVRTLPGRNIIAYSMYGNNTRYTDGALANAKLYQTVYPGWTMRVYHDDTVPKNILDQMRNNGVELVDRTWWIRGGSTLNKMAWRFLAASDPTVARFCSRDIDSRLSAREKAAVDEWVSSGEKFHLMRDHPSHSKYAMSGGMWCATSDAIPDMDQRLEKRHLNQAYLQDMNFLNGVVWPIAQKSVFQHDAFSCDKFGGGSPFPSPRVGWEHVGSVYIDGKMRQVDVDLLKNADIVEKCVVKADIIPEFDPVLSHVDLWTIA